MTQKELLYIEDTLGHLQTMEQLLTQIIQEYLYNKFKGDRK